MSSNPSPFHVAQQTSNNMYKAQTRVNDESAIEQILTEAMQSGDPEKLQSSIGAILSQVSADRQPAAIKVLENTFQNIEKKNLRTKQEKAARDLGVNPNLPESLQKAQYETNTMNDRFNQIVNPNAGGGQQGNLTGNLPNAGQPAANPVQQNLGDNGTPGIPNNQQPPGKNKPNSIRELSTDQLIQLTGIKGFSEPAKAELKRREHDENVGLKREELGLKAQLKKDELDFSSNLKKDETVFKDDLERAGKIKTKADEISMEIPKKKTALNLSDQALANGNLEFWSPDNLAEVTGVEAFRTPEGALFKTAGKEYFLGSISRAGARPNQWIEQQIQDMMSKIGRSTAANFSVNRALRNELELDEHYVEAVNEISNRLRKEGDVSQGQLGYEVGKEMKRFAEEKQKELFNDLRAIKAIEDKKPQKYQKVEKGTKISDFMAQSLLLQFNNDPKKAEAEANKLGYSF